MSGKQLSGQMDLSNFMNMETPTVSDIERKILGDMVIEDFSDDEELDLKPKKKDTVSKPIKKSDAVMSKKFKTKDGKIAFVEYHNYNRIIFQFPDEPEEDVLFDNATDAVDKYVSVLYQMMDNKNLHECKE